LFSKLGGANEGKILASFLTGKDGEGKPCAAEGMDLIVIPPLFLWRFVLMRAEVKI
jgi:hypothetical protein